MDRQHSSWKIVTGIAVIGLFAGCLTEGNYNEKLTRDLCKKAKECNQSEFEAQYSSVGDCVDDAAFEDPATECLKGAGCEFQRSEARNCRQAIRSNSCEDFANVEWVNDCDQVYDCTSEQQAEFVECISDFDSE